MKNEISCQRHQITPPRCTDGGPDEGAGIRALHGFLYSGFTSVFDAGNNPDYIFGLRTRERAGQMVAPRIFATGGVVTAPGGHGGGGARRSSTSGPATCRYSMRTSSASQI